MKNISDLFQKILFKIIYKKIPKTNFGRCIECDASSKCGAKIKCTATMEQQYKIRGFSNLIKRI